ncbi:MAG: PepSY-associated TM helix domain-containing protein [Nostoc sp.]
MSSAESTVFIDPGTGQINGLADVSDILDWIFSLHFSFFLPGGSDGPLSETWGRFSVGVIGGLLVLMLLTGLVLWWPGIKRRLAAFRVRRNNSFVWNYSIHKLIGVIVAIPLLVMTLVMLPYSFGNYSQPVLNFLHIPEMNPPQIMSSRSSPPKTNGEPLSFDQLVNKAIAAAPGSQFISICTYNNERKTNPNLPVDATLTTGYDGALGTGAWGGNVSLQLDRYSGEVLNFQDARESPFLAQAIHGQLWMGIHMGTWGGWTTRILEFLISIAALYLPWTGIRQWWIKQKVRNAMKKDFIV